MEQKENVGAGDILKKAIGEYQWNLLGVVTKMQLIGAMEEYKKPDHLTTTEYFLQSKINYLTSQLSDLTRERDRLNEENARIEEELEDAKILLDSARSALSKRDEENARLTERVKSTEEEWIKTDTMPDYDGDYLCFVVRHNECGTFSKYQRVVYCHMNKWRIDDNRERVICYKKLGPEPQRTIILLNKTPEK